MVADVRLDVNPAAAKQSAAGRILLPVSSVQKRADGSLFVWTVDKNSVAHRTNVTIGVTVGNRVVILSGLLPQSRVVTEGYTKLSEGSKVIYQK